MYKQVPREETRVKNACAIAGAAATPVGWYSTGTYCTAPATHKHAPKTKCWGEAQKQLRKRLGTEPTREGLISQFLGFVLVPIHRINCVPCSCVTANVDGEGMSCGIEKRRRSRPRGQPSFPNSRT